MVTFVENIDVLTKTFGFGFEDIKNFCECGAVGMKAIGPILSYGVGFDFSRLWIQTVKCESCYKLTAVITDFYGNLAVFASEDADREELIEFKHVIKSSGFISNVPIESKPCGAVMRLLPGENCIAEPSKYEHSVVSSTEEGRFDRQTFKEYHDLLMKRNKTAVQSDFNEFYVDVSHRMRHKTAEYVLLQAGDIYVSTAAALVISDKCVFMGAIATREEYTGKGYAKTLIKYICEKYQDKTIYLMCKYDKVAFYENVGLTKIGEFYA